MAGTTGLEPAASAVIEVLQQGRKSLPPVLNWSVEDLVVRSDSRALGVAGPFSQCAFALIVW
jgi:hypothetical protein